MMGYFNHRKSNSGFALPTVLIASVVMLMVLLAGLTAASSSSAAIRQQYYDKLVSEATEAGLVRANNCLAASSQIVTWTDAKPLQPNTDCSGNVLSGSPAPSAYVLDGPTVKTTFSVPAPIDNNGTLSVNVTGTVLRYRTSGIGAPQTQSSTKTGLVGGQNSFSNIAFGYYTGTPGTGVHFSVVLPTGQIKTLGSNGNGRLGNGTTNNATTPTNFILPSGERGTAVYTNFLSVGRNIYATTVNGKVFGAGANDFGQLGNGTTSASAISTPVQFNLPAGVKGKFAATLQNSAFVIGDNNNIYAAGEGAYGQLGVSSSPAANYPTPQRVLLPTPNLSDPNTLPVTDPGWVQPTNMNADRLNIYVRMQGGAVYGWGANDFGQLGNGNTTHQYTPIRMRALSTTGSPYLSATQIAFNGTNPYILDTDGQVWTAGANDYGQLIGMGLLLRNVGNNTACMKKDSASTQILAAASSCNSADGWQFMEFWPDKTWRFRTNSGTSLPTDSMLCATAPATTGTAAANLITMQACTGAANQQWNYQSDMRIRSVSLPSGCAHPNGSVYLAACDLAQVYQQWDPDGSTYLRTIPPPPYDATLGRYPKYVRVSTDNRTVVLLDENGDAWAAGNNNRGQMGTGTARTTFEPVLKKVVIPAGRKVVDIYVTETYPIGITTGADLTSYNNSYFILDDGSVYGAGGNNYGQLGNGATSDFEATPVKMNLPVGVKAKSVQSGFGTTVILTTTGKLYTVGSNAYGQLGDGTTTNSSTPKANAYTNQRSTILY